MTKEILIDVLHNKELPDLIINQQTIDKIKTNPYAPIRQRLGKLRTTEEEMEWRDRILNTPLP